VFHRRVRLSAGIPGDVRIASALTATPDAAAGAPPPTVNVNAVPPVLRIVSVPVVLSPLASANANESGCTEITGTATALPVSPTSAVGVAGSLLVMLSVPLAAPALLRP